MDKWKILGSTKALNSKWFRVRQDKVQLPNGKILDDYFVWESDDVAMVVPITPEGNLILVKQYKHGIQKVMIELPAGFINKSEDPLKAAHRELEEETGCEVLNIKKIATWVSYPTKETGKLFLFLAQVHKTKKQNLDPNEEIELLEVPIPEVMKMINDGQIWATATVGAIYLALENLGKIRLIK